MAQKTFTFSKKFQKIYPKNYIPPGHITIEDEFTDSLLKMGYVVKDIQRLDVLVCTAAKANIPLKERRKMQYKISK